MNWLQRWMTARRMKRRPHPAWDADTKSPERDRADALAEQHRQDAMKYRANTYNIK